MNMNMDVNMYLLVLSPVEGISGTILADMLQASILPISRFGRVFVATRSVRENHPSSLLASVAGIGESDAWKRTQTLPAVGTCEFDSKVDSKKPAA